MLTILPWAKYWQKATGGDLLKCRVRLHMTRYCYMRAPDSAPGHMQRTDVDGGCVVAGDAVDEALPTASIPQEHVQASVQVCGAGRCSH